MPNNQQMMCYVLSEFTARLEVLLDYANESQDEYLMQLAKNLVDVQMMMTAHIMPHKPTKITVPAYTDDGYRITAVTHKNRGEKKEYLYYHVQFEYKSGKTVKTDNIYIGSGKAVLHVYKSGNLNMKYILANLTCANPEKHRERWQNRIRPKYRNLTK